MPTTIIGIDAHKRTHTLVAVNEVGRKIGEKTIPTTTVGHLAAIRWVRTEYGRDVLWGVEDCRSLTGRLERDLLDNGEKIVRVPPHLMSRARASARTPGKSDPIDAMSVARAVLREPDLPVASHDELSWTLKQLVDRRDDLVQQCRSSVNRLLWRVHELDPTFEKPTNWHRRLTRERVEQWLRPWTGLTADLARDELADICRLCEETNTLTTRISDIVTDAAPALLRVTGCGELTAAKIVGEVAGVERFKSEAAFARYVGVAPIPYWSGSPRTGANPAVRPTRRGNRQLNAALHRAAVTQIRLKNSAGSKYYRRRIDDGDTKPQALRALKRRLARVVWQALREDRGLRGATTSAAA